MINKKKTALWIAVTFGVLAGGFFAFSWQPEIAPVSSAKPGSFSAAQIQRGKMLADLGDCSVCHTRAGGERNSGGLAMEIPFGTIYSTNITPDVETGIGNWSYPAFERAMRQGIDRQGRHLYPAFPYTSFTRTSDEDLKALYAFLMSQPAVKATGEKTSLSFPFNIRQGIALWNLIALQTGPMITKQDNNAEWNRGAYLVEGLGHCSACHSPRNLLFVEKSGKDHLTGGEAEGWAAPSLVANSSSPLAWTEQDLMDFIRRGFSANHGVAGGPMGPVIKDGLSQLSAEDQQAIATYLLSLQHGKVSTQSASAIDQRVEQQLEPLTSEGAKLFSGACMACHSQQKGPQMVGVRPSLALNTLLYLDTPDSAIRTVLDGIQHPAMSELGSMPAFRYNLSDRQITALLNYLRQDVAGQPAWADVEKKVAELRQRTSQE